jgi:hypothetical protein
MLTFTIDERDCTPIEDLDTADLQEAHMALDADIQRAAQQLLLIEAELVRRGEEEDNPPDPEPDSDLWDADDDDRSMFADPGGTSALRAASPSNPRNLPCPNCGAPNRLTPKDVALGYQCNDCAIRLEWGCD